MLGLAMVGTWVVLLVLIVTFTRPFPLVRVTQPLPRPELEAPKRRPLGGRRVLPGVVLERRDEVQR